MIKRFKRMTRVGILLFFCAVLIIHKNYSQVRLVSLFQISPERAEIMLDTPFDTLKNNPNDQEFLYKTYNGIYKIAFWLGKSQTIELIPYEKWFKYRPADFLDTKKFEVYHRLLPANRQEIIHEKIEGNWQYTIVKKFYDPTEGEGLEIVFMKRILLFQKLKSKGG